MTKRDSHKQMLQVAPVATAALGTHHRETCGVRKVVDMAYNSFADFAAPGDDHAQHINSSYTTPGAT